MIDLTMVIAFLQNLVLLIPAVSVHEFAHAFVADKLGDRTARHAGRLTLNPIAHLDPMWSIILPLILFLSSGGMFIFASAKPVPIDYRMLNNPKKDIVWIGLAGPLSNFIFAFVCFALLRFIPSANGRAILVLLAEINVFLGVFNLIPIPPLDGSRVLAGLLPYGLSQAYLRIEPYGMLILFVLLMFHGISVFVLPLSEIIIRFLSTIAGAI
ncbi:MAG: site-2 protease family protein [Deltaproteobacteria bacterium]